MPVDLPGTLYFAGESPQWGGGVAFYDHRTPGTTAARGYLVTAEQLADIAAQEMYRDPRRATRSRSLVAGPIAGGRHRLGPGRYETLVEVGRHDGLPLLTFTSPHGVDQVEHTPAAPAYLGDARGRAARDAGLGRRGRSRRTSCRRPVRRLPRG